MVSYAVDKIKAKQKPINLPFPDTRYSTCSAATTTLALFCQQEQRQLVRIGHGSLVHRPHEISAVRQGGGAKGPAIGAAIEGDEESIRKKKRSRDVLGSLNRRSWTSTWLVCLVEVVLVHFGGTGLVGAGRTDTLRVLLEIALTMVDIESVVR